MAGLAAAVCAARRGVKTVLMHERPVLGGNASSEIRMWICGATDWPETGLLEEILLENIYRNQPFTFSNWDSILYEKAKFQENLTLILNCSCCDAECQSGRILSVTGWQMTTQSYHQVIAENFADCSGDSILAPLTGAECRTGRESKDEFQEINAPDAADRKTMGMSCLIQARETTEKQEFIPPDWAYCYDSDEQLKLRDHSLWPLQNFWYLELGGDGDSIADTEETRDELLKVAYGVWDHIKNRGDHNADNWILDWVGFLPGKRESRRYVGDYIMTANDLANGQEFADTVAYGGWPMDNHPPKGFYHDGAPNVNHEVKIPYAIPYRALYSKNISNLWFAGRNISVSHGALTSTRVMATCTLLGQAVGTAAAVAKEFNLSPREVGKQKISQLQRYLQLDDCYLPGIPRQVDLPVKTAKLTVSNGNGECLRDANDRGESNYLATPGSWAEYEFATPQTGVVHLVFDSNLKREWHWNSVCYFPLNLPKDKLHGALTKAFTLIGTREDGSEFEIARVTNNRYRCRNFTLSEKVKKLRLIVDATWGADAAAVSGFELFVAK